MTHDELITMMDGIFTNCIHLAARKNKDYASSDDALENFKDFGFLGVVVRLNDKFKRLKNVTQNKKTAVKDETVLDTLRDIIVYGAIAIIMKEEEDGSTNRS